MRRDYIHTCSYAHRIQSVSQLFTLLLEKKFNRQILTTFVHEIDNAEHIYRFYAFIDICWFTKFKLKKHYCKEKSECVNTVVFCYRVPSL